MARKPAKKKPEVDNVVARLGAYLATARVRRGWRQQDLAKKAGVATLTLQHVESGRPGTGVGAYAAALWALGLLPQLEAVARPESDLEGLTLDLARRGNRAPVAGRLDDDF